ncbi:MAG: hypothetical protein ABSH32_16000 [Bryobacteraceae bacterium]|jgi:hypothetical protein
MTTGPSKLRTPAPPEIESGRRKIPAHTSTASTATAAQTPLPTTIPAFDTFTIIVRPAAFAELAAWRKIA